MGAQNQQKARKNQMNDELRIFTGSSNPKLAGEICRYLDMPLSPLKISRFSNDNMHVQIMENVRERDVFVVQSFTPPVNDHIMELFITLDALRSASARRITVVIPYYSYARSDKKDAPRISITGRLMADLMVTAGANRVLTMDLHAPQVQGFFSIPVDHLTAIPTIADHVRQNYDLTRAVVVAAESEEGQEGDDDGPAALGPLKLFAILPQFGSNPGQSDRGPVNQRPSPCRLQAVGVGLVQEADGWR
jgi:phosphoribosylpyrophosphate synthetase